MKPVRRGFTLIELLVVVGIISILAAIALPNFLEAQIRAKCARVKQDLRVVALAWEAYAVDNNRYPMDWDNNPIGIEWMQIGMIQVTTPIAYLTTWPIDPFSVMKNPSSNEYAPHFEACSCEYAYCIYSLGPDFMEGFDGNDNWPDGVMDSIPGRSGQMYTGPITMRIFDPTNGVISDGDIPRLGGDWHRDRPTDKGGPWTVFGVDYKQWHLPFE